MTKTYEPQNAWDNQWVKPKLDDIVAGLDEPFPPQYEMMIKGIQELEYAHCDLKWQGPDWKWSMHATLKLPKAKQPKQEITLAYLVPWKERPQYCIPMSDEAIKSLPKRKLSKYLREGIRSGKWTTDIFWVYYMPPTEIEIRMILELLGYYHDYLVEQHLGTPS